MVLLLNVTQHGDTHKLGTWCCRFRKPVYQLAMLNQAISSIVLTPVLPSTHLTYRQCPCARRSCQAPLRWGCSQHRVALATVTLGFCHILCRYIVNLCIYPHPQLPRTTSQRVVLLVRMNLGGRS